MRFSFSLLSLFLLPAFVSAATVSQICSYKASGPAPAMSVHEWANYGFSYSTQLSGGATFGDNVSCSPAGSSAVPSRPSAASSDAVDTVSCSFASPGPSPNMTVRGYWEYCYNSFGGFYDRSSCFSARVSCVPYVPPVSSSSSLSSSSAPILPPQGSCSFCADCEDICAVYSGIDPVCLGNCLSYYCPSNPVCNASSSASSNEIDFSPMILSNEVLSHVLIAAVMALSFLLGFAVGNR